ncbi:5-formyltetrahydrofolate cyclo-ligase [Geomicrobium sp. JCM 19055]|nr:5-formyltetrahydrofolate cyclo-ligase [Geomicrobium sp. JCM 19055]
MDFYILSSFENLVTSSFGVLEPDATSAKQIDKALIDVVVVPGVAYDDKGFRVGYGGGYYDTFLEEYPRIATMSLLYDFQLQRKVHVEPHDQRVDYLIIEGEKG